MLNRAGLDKASILRIWEPLVGRPAAVAIFRGKRVLSLAPIVGLAYIVLVFVAVHAFPSGAAVVAWVAGVLMLGFLLSAALFVWQWHRAAGKALGIKITSRNAPPGNLSDYLVWCKRNDLEPLSASEE